MGPDDRAAHSGKDAKPSHAKPQPVNQAERTDLFEEFKREPQPGEKPKPKGLNAAGYKFPPEDPNVQPAMTKENMAKGITFDRSRAGEAPPPALADANAMFETYERPDLKEHPRTGGGLRPPPPKSAKEILADFQHPEPTIVPAKRAPNPSGGGNERTLAGRDDSTGADHDAAHLDAEADLAATKGATMSHSRRHGPMKVHTDEDPFREMPKLPGDLASAAPAATTVPTPRISPAPIASSAPKPTAHFDTPIIPPLPLPTKSPSMPHRNDAPAPPPGEGPRIGLLQADFNLDLTTKMASEAIATAKGLGCTVAHHVHAPGVYDVPLIAKALLRRGDVDALVVVGAVIQGETGHDQLIATECARKLADLAYETEKPVGFGVIGPRMTRAQAEARVSSARTAVESVVKQWRTLKALAAARLVAT